MPRLGNSILRACVALATRWPWVVVCVAVLLTVAAGYASRDLTLDTSVEGILSADLPFRQVEENYRAAFPQQELAVVVVDADTPEAAEKAAGALVARLAERADVFEQVELAGASPYFDRYGLLFLSPEEIEAAGEKLRPSRRLLSVLSRDPSLRGLDSLLKMAGSGVAEGAAPTELAGFLSDMAAIIQQRADGQPAEIHWKDIFSLGAGNEATRRIVQAKPVLDDTSLDRAGNALAALDADMTAVGVDHPDARMRLTGLPVLRQQELNDVFSGAVYASALSFVLVALSLILGIRSGRLIVALMLTLIVGSIWTTGLAAMAVGRLNLISVAFLVLFFGLGVDFGTHLGLRHLEEARKGKPFGEALAAAMHGEGAGISLSALCAALAFLAFVPTSYVGLAEFGIISALGMVVAVVATFTLQPALMALMPPQPRPGAPITIGIGRWTERHHRPILVVAAVATLVAGWLALGARLDVDPLNLQNPKRESVRTYLDLARDPETTPYALNVLAPDFDAAAELAPHLAEVGGVSGVRWIGDLIPSDQPKKLEALAAVRERMGDAFFADEAQAPPPSDEELQQGFEGLRASTAGIASAPGVPDLSEAAGRLGASLDAFAETVGTEPEALRELGRALAGEVPETVEGLRQKLSVAEPVTIDDIPPDLASDWVSADGELRLAVLPAGDISAEPAMERFARAVQAVAPGASGVPASIMGAGEAISSAFVEAIIYTAVAIALVVAILRRRVSDVLLVLVPLAVAAIWTVAASAALDLPFNFANIIVVPLLIGLGVASSVHIVVRAHELVQDASGTHEEGMHVLETSTPLAVLIAQLNTVAAFATLAVSEHRGMYSMGVLLGISILFVLIVCLIVLPAFMIALARRSQGSSPLPP